MQSKKPKCPNGTRRNRKTGDCQPINKENKTALVEKIELPPQSALEDTIVEPPQSALEDTDLLLPEQPKKTKKYCPRGQRRNAKTGLCETIKTQEKMEFLPVETNVVSKQNFSNTPLIELVRYTQKQDVVKDTQDEETEEDDEETEEDDEETEEDDKETEEDDEETEEDKETDDIVENIVIQPEPIQPELIQPEPIQTSILNQHEKERKEAIQAESTDSTLYPILGEYDFSKKIARRKEFADTIYNGTIEGLSIMEEADKICNSSFELSPHQLFVKNFLSFQTPYNTLLLYHGLGTGKTCSAIGIAEESRAFMKQSGHNRKIIVIASPNVRQNFRVQLFDERKLEQTGGIWNIDSCVGNQLLSEVNPLNLMGHSRERIIQQIRTIIKKSYAFMGYGEFANFIDRHISVSSDSGLSPEESKLRRLKNIKHLFNKRLVIIDEVHNMRLTDTNNNKRAAILLNEVAYKSDDMRLLVLSATPMYNSYAEIIWLTNLLNANDKRALIKQSDVFDTSGDFVKGSTNREGGKELLVRKLKGYVSYVRGENPFTFPYRVYPEVFAPEHTIRPDQYPKKQMNLSEIETPIKHVPVYTNTISEYQNRGYDFIMKDMLNRSYDKNTITGATIHMPSFENMEGFGYTLLLAPMEALNIVYPNKVLDKYSMTESNEKLSQEKRKAVISSYIGKDGLNNTMTMKQQENPYPLRYNYQYKPGVLKEYGRVFSSPEISKYSHKISNICDIIKKSKGIVLIYSQFIDGGIVPMALALEELGFARYGSAHYTKNLFKTPPGSPIDSSTLQEGSVTGSFKQAKYVMITGDKHFSPNNGEDIKYITSPDNKNGELVKVVLISKAANEGLDFKNIRQVHILDPWYNMNRNEQIIGRGVRHLSCCNLPFEERNVEIYLHGTKTQENDVEMADLYVYRVAEKKAIEIGRITRLLKEVAVDCHLNISQTNFTQEKISKLIENQNIHINLSSGKQIKFKPGDKPYTDICDYMDNCDFKCSGSKMKKNDSQLIENTYTDVYVQNTSIGISKRIREMFQDRSVYKRDHLISGINFYRRYPIEHTYYSLSQFINNHTEVVDKYGRKGYLINKGLYYAFQPSEIGDEYASVYERETPVPYKNETLVLEIPEEFSVKSPGKKEPKLNKMKDEPEIEIPSAKTYDVLLTEIFNNIAVAYSPKTVVYSGEYDFYKYANTTIEVLTGFHAIPKETITKYFVYHWLDVLGIPEKQTLIKKMYFPETVEQTNPNPVSGDEPTKKQLEEYIRTYFDSKKFLIGSQNKYAFLMATKSKNTFVVYDEETKEFIQATYSDKQDIDAAIKESLTVDINKIHAKLMGFMYEFKNQDVVFKIKDFTQVRNNMGAKASSADKNDLISKLSSLKYSKDIYTDTIYDKQALCVVFEFLCRYLTDTTDKVYFMNFEQAIYNNVVKLKILKN